MLNSIRQFFSCKCKYWKICKLYQKDSVTCNKNSGMYHANLTEPAGCYRKLKEAENETK